MGTPELIRRKRYAALLAAVAGCANATPRSPQPPEAPVALVVGYGDTRADAVGDESAPRGPAEARRLAEGTRYVAGSGSNVYLVTMVGGRGARVVRRGLEEADDAEGTELAPDVRLTPRSVVSRVRVEGSLLLVGQSEGIFAWDLDGGAPRILANDPHGARDMASDEAFVYFVGSDCGVRRVAKTGGAVQTIVAGQTGPCGIPSIAVDASEAFYVSGDSVLAAPKTGTGGAARTLLPREDGRYVLGLAQQGEDVYVLLSPAQPQTDDDREGRLVRVPKSGGAPIELARPRPSGMAHTLASDGRDLYWLGSKENGNTTVSSMKIGGGPVRLVSESPGLPYEIDVTSRWVVWTSWEMKGRPSKPVIWGVPK